MDMAKKKGSRWLPFLTLNLYGPLSGLYPITALAPNWTDHVPMFFVHFVGTKWPLNSPANTPQFGAQTSINSVRIIPADYVDRHDRP